MPLAIGDAVPDLTFLRPDGSPWRLTEMTARPLVLIFLRHLA
jgi:peroxiredoxin